MKELLSYLHPALQVLGLLLALAVLRLGLALKRHRTGQRRLHNRPELFQRHTQLGLLFVGLLASGYALGIGSMALFREQAPFRSSHFFFASLALLLWLGGGYTGWCLKRGTSRYADVRDIHGFVVYLGLFISLGAAVMGFILLP